MEAAKSKTGSSKKSNLNVSPFRRDLKYSTNNKGYWTYYDMIMQVEDCIDCLNVINKNEYQYLFLFNHSNRHDCTAPDASKADAIRKHYGGKQPRMHNTVIENDNFLGPYQPQCKLQVSQTQNMTFKENDIGPYYLTPQQRLEQRFDRVTGTKTIKLTKPQLIIKLKEKGVSNLKGGTKKYKQCVRQKM